MVSKALKILLPVICALLLYGSVTNSLPLSTRNRWIIDAASGQRVKMHCVNWVAHMQPLLVEGLDRRPLKDIAARISSFGFNCVRLTWATFMFTDARYAELTVMQSLRSLNLSEAMAGIANHNPSMVNLTVVDAYGTVIDVLGEYGLMVVLDNHVSKPQWCCGSDDGNGFFGDEYFDPEEWFEGLAMVAERFRGKSQVVGMSMRNELRGPRQNEAAWYQYIRNGARRVHKANPDVLVIVSGLNYDTDLSFLRRLPLAPGSSNNHLNKKLVYEAHWYAFSEGRRHDWELQSPNAVCNESTRIFERRAGFIVNQSPLFVSEFGVDQRGENRADNRFLSCFLAFAVERDLDWAMWALQGSYYLRNGRAGFEETYGVMDMEWDEPRNPKFGRRFRLLQQMIQDPSSNASAHSILYHPLSGYCGQASIKDNTVQASDCQSRSRWSYDSLNGGPIRLMGTNLCLRVVGDGLPVMLSNRCSDERSNWTLVSSSKLQIGVMDANGRAQCLDKSYFNSSVFTRECLCLEDSVCNENPETQWFKLIESNIA